MFAEPRVSHGAPRREHDGLHGLHGLHVVLARCSESSSAPSRLSAAGVPWTVVQKGGVRCNSSRAVARAARSGLGDAQRHHVRWLAHNRGDECAAYLQWIVDHYDALPELVAFVQFGAERQLLGGDLTTTLRMVIGRARELGYTALSRHSFQGAWPAPCEPAAKQRVFATGVHTMPHQHGARTPHSVPPMRYLCDTSRGAYGCSRARPGGRKRPAAGPEGHRCGLKCAWLSQDAASCATQVRQLQRGAVATPGADAAEGTARHPILRQRPLCRSAPPHPQPLPCAVCRARRAPCRPAALAVRRARHSRARAVAARSARGRLPSPREDVAHLARRACRDASRRAVRPHARPTDMRGAARTSRRRSLR